jgi:hypothetical protein
MTTHTTCAWRGLVGVAIATVAVMVSSANRAEAACGDYIHYPSATAPTDTPTNNPGVADSHAPDGADLPPQPCHGPNCSRKPSAPVTPIAPATPSPNDGKVCGIIPILTGDSTPAEGSRSPADGRFATLQRPNPIFHPPRAG